MSHVDSGSWKNPLTADIHPSLKTSAADHAERVLRAITSAVDVVAPGVGSIFGELIGTVIPNRRSQRFEEFLTRLARRINTTDQRLDALIERLGAEQIALFEDGARGAVRATSSERIDRIARLVARGLTADEIEAERSRVLVDLLERLTEADLRYLDGFIYRQGRDPRGSPEPKGGLDYGPAFEALSAPEQWKIALEVRARVAETKAIEEYRVAKLIGLNLLIQPIELTPGRPLLGGGVGLPQMTKDHIKLTPLGRLILDRAGLGQATWDEVLEREREARLWQNHEGEPEQS